jgi:hypothetical protein
MPREAQRTTFFTGLQSLGDRVRAGVTPLRAEERRLLDQDIAGPQGLTQAEKARQAAAIARPAAAVSAGVAGQAARQALATGSQFTGAAQRAQMQALEQGTQALSQAGAETERTSAQLAEARKQSILGRLAREGEIGRSNLQGVLKGAGAAVGAAAAGPAGASVGQLGAAGIGAGLGLLGRVATDTATTTPKASELSNVGGLGTTPSAVTPARRPAEALAEQQAEALWLKTLEEQYRRSIAEGLGLDTVPTGGWGAGGGGITVEP